MGDRVAKARACGTLDPAQHQQVSWAVGLDQPDIQAMLEEQKIEIAPLAFMRGRTFKSAYIIADEMQNATPSQCKMLMTRIGEGSKIVITGDIEQADRKGAWPQI